MKVSALRRWYSASITFIHSRQLITCEFAAPQQFPVYNVAQCLFITNCQTHFLSQHGWKVIKVLGRWQLSKKKKKEKMIETTSHLEVMVKINFNTHIWSCLWQRTIKESVSVEYCFVSKRKEGGIGTIHTSHKCVLGEDKALRKSANKISANRRVSQKHIILITSACMKPLLFTNKIYYNQCLFFYM